MVCHHRKVSLQGLKHLLKAIANAMKQKHWCYLNLIFGEKNKRAKLREVVEISGLFLDSLSDGRHTI